jgi:hypothetical protein
MHFSLFFKKKNWFEQTEGKRVRMTGHIAVDCKGHEQQKNRCGGKIRIGTTGGVTSTCEWRGEIQSMARLFARIPT